MNVDLVVFIFVLGNIAWNISESRKRPIQSFVFGSLWVALAISIGIKALNF